MASQIRGLACMLLLLCSLHSVVGRPVPSLWRPGHERKLSFLVTQPLTVLIYHNGLILSSGEANLPVYIIWYGNFSHSQRAIVLDFFSSISSSAQEMHPTVISWWQVMTHYVVGSGLSVPSSVSVGAEISDPYSKGLSLTNADIEALVLASLSTFPTNVDALYFVLTAEDVVMEDFCTNSCASHFATTPVAASKNQRLAYAWVGNAATQCAGKCAWPFAQPKGFGPNAQPLLPPNEDVGMDGMIINIASMLAGAATNPFDDGFYQGDGAAPLEAATACAGLFGKDSYIGSPGILNYNNVTKASYNANGVNGRQFLLPQVWDPNSQQCTPPS